MTLKLTNAYSHQMTLTPFHTSFPTTYSADFPSTPLYDEVEVAFTLLPGGLTKELLIYGSPYCIQIPPPPRPPPGLK